MYHTWCTIDFVDSPCAAHGRCDVRTRPNFGLFYLTINLGQNIGLNYLMQHGLAQGLATTLRPMLSPLYHLYMLLSSIVAFYTTCTRNMFYYTQEEKVCPSPSSPSFCKLQYSTYTNMLTSYSFLPPFQRSSIYCKSSDHLVK